MKRVLLTAFGPYGAWEENASWLSLVELTCELPVAPAVTTRLYPVDFDVVRERLEEDLSSDFDCAIHLGQAPGAACLQLEAIGINVQAASATDPQQPQPLIADGPVAFQSTLPLASWAGRLRGAGIPARVSYHAGTFLCNATLYMTHYLCERYAWRTQATFLHLPLNCSQVFARDGDYPSLPSSVAAQAIRLILSELTDSIA